MSETEWEPFGLDDDERAAYEVLVDGVPDWMAESLYAWIVQAMPVDILGGVLGHVCRTIQNQCRVALNVSAAAATVDKFWIADRLRSISPTDVLRVGDWLLAHVADMSERDALDALLHSGRSLWMVGERNGRFGLVRRVPEGVQRAVESTIASAGKAGGLLARAWADVHGIEQKPSSGYSLAVRAVEAAAIPVVQPKNTSATLGTVLGQMKADGDWRLPLREHTDAPGPEMLLAMMRTLWFGHRDRHGGADYSDVTQDEARAAVMLAATLVEWLSSGAIERRP